MIKWLLQCFLFLFGSFFLNAQQLFDARQSVIMQAEVNENQSYIKLTWVFDPENGGYTIWRKTDDQNFWGDSLIYLNPASTTWTDTSVIQGVRYEYQILKSLPAFPYGNGTPNYGSGYISSGIKIPPNHHRGACLVVIDKRFELTLALETERLLHDLTCDGWQADTLFVHVNEPVVEVKKAIMEWRQKTPSFNHAIFLLGRVPVPYSGDIAPDGHHADHRGAWPCDGYYGTLDGVWTDQTIQNTTAPGSRNDNIPGDGKFDNNVYPSEILFQTGRVDFSNMTKFSETEEQLLRRYLNKNHAWRQGRTPVSERGLVDNNFGDIEGLGQTGWRNFAAMFGIQKVKDLPYRQTLTNQSYMWSYGCGGGGPESASDISSTTFFTTDSLQTNFTLLFGSYFGDWDYPNNFLRGAIASRTCLAAAWGNRPVWFLHHMAMGEPIGYAAKITMNNRGLYTPRFYGGYVSTALMGDPTIRMHVLQPVAQLTAQQQGASVRLDWTPPTDAEGYYIYRKSVSDSMFVLLNEEAITDTFFLDPCLTHESIQYMVRCTALKTSGSGSYYNLSQGVIISVSFDTTVFYADIDIKDEKPGQSDGSIQVIPFGSCTPYSYLWDTGETTDFISGLTAGKYTVTVSDCLGCTRMYSAVVNQISSSRDLENNPDIKIFPNPVHDILHLQMRFQNHQNLQITISDIEGRNIETKFIAGKDISLDWDIRHFPSGMYRVYLKNYGGHFIGAFTKN
jgi:hypothetical protein